MPPLRPVVESRGTIKQKPEQAGPLANPTPRVASTSQAKNIAPPRFPPFPAGEVRDAGY
jgi:hypothetical protein